MPYASGFLNRALAAVRRMAKGEHYELSGSGELLHKFPFGRRLIAKDCIKAWGTIPEMGVDFVKIDLLSGERLLLSDRYNELTGLLSKIALDKKVELC